MNKLSPPCDAAEGLRRRRGRPPRRRRRRAELEPIIIGHGAVATSIDGMPWALPGDQLIIGAAGKLAAAIVTEARDADHTSIVVLGGRDIAGDVRVMHAPTLPRDRRALVGRGWIEGAP